MAEDTDAKALLEQLKQINSKLDSFREHFEAQLDRLAAVIKSEFEACLSRFQ
jgi:hypothetical protein